jgi:6-phosphogluconolactonase
MRIDLNTGALTSLNSVLGPGNAFTIAADSAAKFLYSSDFNTGVYAYSIDGHTGNLTPLNGSPYTSSAASGGNGGPLAIDPAGGFLFYSDAFGNIATFIRKSDGTLAASTAPGVADMYQPLALAVDPAGKFLYASNHSDFSGGGQISVFSIDPTTGGLSPVGGSPFAFTQTNSEPWGLAVSSDGNFLYTALSNTNQIAVLSIDRTSGALSLVSGSPYSAGASIPEQLVLSSSGKYLYVGNASVGSISAFSVASSGTLALVQSPFTTIAYFALAVDPSGKFLFSSPNTLSNQAVVWSVDQKTGALAQAGSIPSVNGAPTALTSIALP